MKKAILIISVLVLFFSCGEKKGHDNDAKLEGLIKNTRNDKVFINNNDAVDTLKLDENGKFIYYVDLKEATYLQLRSGSNSINVYLSPKSETTFEVDSRNIEETLQFSGTDGDINNYLWKQLRLISSAGVNSADFLYSSDYNIFKTSLEDLMGKFEENLNEFEQATGNKYDEFVKLEEQRKNIIESFLLLNYYIPKANENIANEDLELQIENSVKKIDIENPDVVKIQEFKSFAQPLVVYRLHKKINSEDLKFESIPEYSKAYFSMIDQTFSSDEVREELYYGLISEFINHYGVESVEDAYEEYKRISTDKERLNNLENIFMEQKKLDPGNPSVNFSFPDINGKTYSLSDFKGKYVYIDVWASWCGPCRAEIPYLKSLKEKFKSKNLVILGVSVDEERDQWVNMLQSQNLDGIQLFAGGWNNPLCNFYKITGIPRFILIDRDGNIINSNAERPSGRIEDVLNSLEGI